MRMGRVKGLKPEDTRRRIVDGAVDAFANLGFETARVADIAAAAGLSSGALYNHFGSKADLLAAVIEKHVAEHLRNELQTAPPSELFDALLNRARHLATDDFPEAPLLIGAVSAARLDPDVKRVLSDQFAGYENEWVDMIEAAQKAGHFAADIDARAATRFVRMVQLGAYVESLLDLPAPEAGAWDRVMTKVLTGLNADPGEHEEAP